MNTDDAINDELQEQQDTQQELMETQQEQLEASYPVSKQESNLYNLFWKVYKVKDSTKVANLGKAEIGSLNISVRDSQKIGMLGNIFHHQKFGNFFFALGEITNSTSMAKDGWFTELFVSQKKQTVRAKKSSLVPGDSKWQLFGKKSETQTEKVMSTP